MENRTVAMSLSEFKNLEENKKLKSNINSCAIFCYIVAAITIIVCAITKNWFGLIDVCLVVLAGVFLHTASSRIAAILLLVYSVANCIMALINTGKPSGYLVIVAAIYAIQSTFALHKAWKEYQEKYGITGKTF